MDLSLAAERPVVFVSEGQRLLGIVSSPEPAAGEIGVVVVVGGPQYRAGSHRQFTLLCRDLARQGIASIRFDYHGIGDSEGEPALGVGGIEADIGAAIEALLQHAPRVRSVVLWGLCGAASAAALYAPGDRRVAGLVMLNPWVRTEHGFAKAQLRHYYLARIKDREFWLRFVRGDVSVGSSARALAGQVRNVLSGGRRDEARSAAAEGAPPAPAGDLPEQMLRCLQHARVPALVVLSGDKDLTANEFRDLLRSSDGWRRWLALPRVRMADVEGSNHTFARAEWRDEVATLTIDWVRGLASTPGT